MTELEYFQYFKDHQLHSVDFDKGILNVYVPVANQFSNTIGRAIVKDVGSKNEDGYIRVWCGARRLPEIGSVLKMRHRLMYFLYHNSLPDGLEIDHIDRIRGNDSIHNLRAVDRQANCINTKQTVTKGTYDSEKILEVCLMLQNTNDSDLTIAKLTGISRNYVRDIKKRRRQAKVSQPYNWGHRD